MVKQYWQDTEPIYLSTSSLFRFSKKLKGLKPQIQRLAKEKMGNLVKKSREAYVDLCEKHETSLHHPSQQHLELENEALRRWEFVARLEESYLKQKSKLHWLKIGDQNNKTYHRAVATREAVNCIKEVRCRNGTRTSDESEIKIEAESFFREFLQYQPEDNEGMGVEQLQELIPFRCTETDSQQLLRPVTPEEIRGVLFSMPNNKSPGPDGYNSEFYKSSWEIIGAEFTIAVQSFFALGFLPKGINSTIIALIPKKT